MTSLKLSNLTLKLFLIFLLLAHATLGFSQANQWTWMKGSSSVQQNGTYGTQGTAASSNTPGSRYGVASWTDSIGDLWLFGGYGLTSNSQYYLNDLWKFTISSNQWTWIKGSNVTSQTATYGTQGTAASTNNPGARIGSVSWTDFNGDLWLFGGLGHSSSGFGELNDLWKYDIASNQWTWMKGSNSSGQNGTYGTQGTAAASNTPGARQGSVSWIDTNGYLWLLGGYGYSGSSNGNLNDLWKYDVATNQWTWISGSNGVNQNGTYGTQGTAASSNTPGARINGISWKSTDGNLWLFGGQGYASSSSGYLNDLWKYDISANQWIWVKGSNSTYQSGTYGSQGVPAASNTPGARSRSAACTDTLGNLWLFGGLNGSSFNDLWKYEVNSNQWVWMKGSSSSNQTGTYGTQGASSSTNTPGGRYSPTAWLGLSGNIWLFGGTNNSAQFYNDLWRYVPLYCNVSISITSQIDVSCNGTQTGSLTATQSEGVPNFTYSWSNAGSTSNTSSSTDSISSLSAGTYTVTVTDVNGCSASTSATITEPDLLTVALAGTDPVCDYDNNGALSSATAGGTTPYSYTWNNSANTADIADLFEGTYAVTVTDSNGCVAEAEETITAQSHLAIMIDSTADVLCFGDSSGWVSVLASMGAEPYTYAWSNGGTAASQNAGAGAHTVTVTDNLGCQADTNATITEPTLLTSTLSIANEICDGDSNGTITAAPAGGTSPYTYTWSNGQTSPTATDLAPGVYDLIVTDLNGCALHATDTVLPGNPLPQPDLGADTLFTTSVVYTLDPGVFDSYEWSDGSTNSTLDVSASGNYWVNVFDGDGCTGADSINVTIWPTGISEQSAGTISVFPNPTLGQLTIMSSINFDRNAQFELMSAQGQLVMVINAADQTDTVKLNLESLAKGNYTLRVSSSAMVKTFSVVVM